MPDPSTQHAAAASPVPADERSPGGGRRPHPLTPPGMHVKREGDQLLSRRTELVLREIESLPTLPVVATRLLQLGAQDTVEIRDIVRLLEADPTLTARLLALCRRAANRTRHPITTVEMAVVMLGLEAVRSLVLSVHVFEWGQRAARRRTVPGGKSVGGRPGDANASQLDRVGFWQHSIAVACCADLISREHPELDLKPEEAFVCGLVHDLGKLALDLVLPRAYARVIDLSTGRQGNIADFERPIVGMDHHTAGMWLAERWGLSTTLSDVMGLHGRPYDALPDVEHRRTIALVGVADAMCRRLSLGWSGNFALDPSDRELCVRAGLNWARIEGVTHKLYEATSARCRDLGLGEEPSQQLLVESILKANARLARVNQDLVETNQALKDAQQQLAETQSLVRLGEMTAGAAHEMNNPLAVISGRAQALLDRMSQEYDRNAARAIVDASARLTHLVDRLHRIATPPKPVFRPTEVGRIVEETIGRARVRAAAGAPGNDNSPATASNTLGIKLNVADGIEPARLDGGLFSDALIEVLANAIESSPRSPIEVRVFEQQQSGSLIVQVVDDGVGMSERALEHALDPFFSEKPAGRQSGLGLALAHRLIQLHDGTLALESRFGKGTTVTISLRNWRWSRSAHPLVVAA